MQDHLINKYIAEVRGIRFLTPDTFLIRFERKGMVFLAGQYVSVGLKGSTQRREYSVYSSEKDNELEILVREVVDGSVSQQLKGVKPGDELDVYGPKGTLKLRDEVPGCRHVFIATGTGIAPFHSMLISNPGIDYYIIHGVRYGVEAYERSEYDPDRYTLCTTGDSSGNHTGRVNGYISSMDVRTDDRYYLCGNSGMIYPVYNILTGRGIPAEQIHLEVYF